MQLIRINKQDTLKVEGVLEPKRFQQLLVAGGAGKEEHIEELLLAYPSLLNKDGYVSPTDPTQRTDLLIISRQITTAHGKRADLLAIDRDGSLVIVEVKRDAEDEAGRNEGMEFQAIRYAAACRKMNVAGIIDTFAEHLRDCATLTSKVSQTHPTDDLDVWRKKAVLLLCKHLADEDEEEQLNQTDLEKLIDPRSKQRIYLVAAGFSREAISACAWLREHNIDISCFVLRPYELGGQLLIGLERLIPPPVLDELMTDSISRPDERSQAAVDASGAITRAPSNKPTRLIWGDDEQNPVLVSNWKGIAAQAIRKALIAGLKPEQLPMTTARSGSDMFSAVYFESHSFYADLHGSSETVRGWVGDILDSLKSCGKVLTARIETKNGSVIDIPGTAALPRLPS